MDNGEKCYERFLAGDNEGLADIIRLYRDGLVIYINSIVRNMELAEEIMEDTFVKLYVKKPKFSGKSSFKTWLYSIGRFTAVDCLRRSKKPPEISCDELPDIANDEDLERGYIKKEDKLTLHKTIKKLRSDYSQILYLVYFEGFSNSEAASIMNKSNKQIRDLLCNAKKALRKELERSGFEYEGL